MTLRWRGWLGRVGTWVLLLLMATAGAIQAQSSPSDIFVDEEVSEEAQLFESLTGFTGYGGSAGFIRFYGPDGVDGAQLRPVLQANFRYRFDERWIGVGEFGFGWNAFEARGDSVLAMNFGTVSALREFTGLQGFVWRAGGGLGFYRWNYKFNGKSLRDPVSQRFYRGFEPGVVLALEGERRITPHATFTAAIQNHYIFSGDDKFDVGFDSNLSALTFRIGLHYHFSPYEGILWEREEEQGLRLDSGQGS